ncbi:MAG: glycosyltransferase family 1 protein [Chloroflexi bacterium]|nr:MAG: glycosyltransferase family 1 protein [Chloroflexota bacterium]
MRIAVYENLPPGGALRASFELGRQLLQRGHTLDLFRLSTYAEKGPFDLAPLIGSVRVESYRPALGLLDARLSAGRLGPRSLTAFGALRRAHRRLAAQIRAGGYDAVLLHPDGMTQAPYALRWLDGLRTVYYCQEPPRFATERAILDRHRRRLASSPFPIGLARLVEDRLVSPRLIQEDRASVAHATVIAVNSVYSRERAWAAYQREALVVHLGVDADRFQPASDQVARAEVLSVGSPAAAKGHDQVIEALALLPAASRPALRVVLGRGERSDLAELAAARGVTLEIEAGLGEAELARCYQRALATVCAARLEPFGLTAIESLACATPVVAIREAGYRDSVEDGVNGFLTDPEPAALAEAVGRLCSDPHLARRLGRAGREQVLDRWTWEHAAARLEAILTGRA